MKDLERILEDLGRILKDLGRILARRLGKNLGRSWQESCKLSWKMPWKVLASCGTTVFEIACKILLGLRNFTSHALLGAAGGSDCFGREKVFITTQYSHYKIAKEIVPLLTLRT